MSKLKFRSKKKYRRYKGHSEVLIYLSLDCPREMTGRLWGKSHIWTDNDQGFAKTDQRYQPRYSRISANHEQD